ncbi:MAG: type IV pilus secretin PilQ [Candidatus Acidiferrales bacterium]
MRIIRRASGLAALVAAGLFLASSPLRAADQPVVHVKAVVHDGTVSLEAQANGPFDYTTYRPSESLFVLDLSGVKSGDPAGARIVASDLIKSYRVLSYAQGPKPVVRVEILLNQGVEPRLERKDGQDLTLFVSRGASAAALSPAPAITPVSASVIAPKSGPESISQVHLAQNGAQTEVTVLGNGPLAYHAIRLQNPDRLVLDFAGAHLRTSTKQIPSNLDPVREIRLAQFSPEVSRIVIDLREPAHYNINSAPNGITVAFAPAAASPASKPAPAPEDPAGLQTTKSIVAPTPAVVPVETASVAPAQSAPVSSVAAPVATLPATLTQSAALASNSDASAAEPHQSDIAAATPAPAAASPAPAPAFVTADFGAPAPAPLAVRPSAHAVGQPIALAASGVDPVKYSGEPISVNLKDVDLRDFFRLIHEISGLNVVVDPAVKGSLTIVLDDVPWDQALDIVLKNNDLEKQLDGNVLRIATRETLRKEAAETRDLAKAQIEAADVVTTTRVLSYAKSDDMIPTVKQFLTSRGAVLSDSRSNTLIIRDVPSVFPVIDNLLRQLDRKSQQVEIEARVVAANRSFSREIGTQLGLALGNASRSNVAGGDGQVGSSPITRGFPAGDCPPILIGGCTSSTTSGALPLATALGTSVPTSGISYAFTSANFALDFIINAAEDRGVGKLLSKPKVITQNNQKATVKQGTRIPVQTIINNTVSVQYVDAVLELDVTPQITAEGTIFMDVDVKNDQIDQSIPRVQGIPAIDTQEANTKVLVVDGGTVVIGGVIVTQQRTDVQQVPLFGSLPVVGNLFKHTTVSSSSQELLFFLTPRILPS